MYDLLELLLSVFPCLTILFLFFLLLFHEQGHTTTLGLGKHEEMKSALFQYPLIVYIYISLSRLLSRSLSFTVVRWFGFFFLNNTVKIEVKYLWVLPICYFLGYPLHKIACKPTNYNIKLGGREKQLQDYKL